MFGRAITGTFIVFGAIGVLDCLSPNGFANPPDSSPRIFRESDFGKNSSVVSTGAMRVLDSESDNPKIFPLSRLKIDPRNSYCWFAMIKPGIREVKVDEILILPAPPESWGKAEPSEISKDRTTYHRIKNFPVSPDPEGEHPEGLVYRCWGTDEGDPEGLGEFVLRINDQEVGRFGVEFYK